MTMHTFNVIYRTTPWVICSEIFPIETRGMFIAFTELICDDFLFSNLFLGFKVAVSSGAYFATAALSTQITSIVINSVLGIVGYLYGVIGLTIISFVIVLLALPETKVRIKDICIIIFVYLSSE